MNDQKPVCGICGATLPECGSFVQCRIFPTGYACSACCVECIHFFWAGSLPKCRAALKEQNGEKNDK